MICMVCLKTQYGLDFTKIEVEKDKLDSKISLFDLTPTELDEDDPLIVAGHPFIGGVQKPLQITWHKCMKILGRLSNV